VYDKIVSLLILSLKLTMSALNPIVQPKPVLYSALIRLQVKNQGISVLKENSMPGKGEELR
jgi:hypothetical protein